MTRRGWAEQWVDKADPHGKLLMARAVAIDLLKAEHARAVRIVTRYIRLVECDQHVYTEMTKKMVLAMLKDVRAALTKGRA